MRNLLARLWAEHHIPEPPLTVRLWLVDGGEQPVTEVAEPRRAEALFAETRDDEARWPNVCSAELVGPDGDVMDRW